MRIIFQETKTKIFLNIKIFRSLENISNVIIPMIYLVEEAFIDEETRSEVLKGVTALYNSRIIAGVSIFFGIVFLVAFAVLAILKKSHNSNVSTNIV